MTKVAAQGHAKTFSFLLENGFIDDRNANLDGEGCRAALFHLYPFVLVCLA